MSDSSIGMHVQDKSEREKFEVELKTILKASEDAGILMRVIGSLAFQMHCPQFGYLQSAMGRSYIDIDFGAYNGQARQIRELMTGMGYIDNRGYRGRDGKTRFRLAEIMTMENGPSDQWFIFHGLL